MYAVAVQAPLGTTVRWETLLAQIEKDRDMEDMGVATELLKANSRVFEAWASSVVSDLQMAGLRDQVLTHGFQVVRIKAGREMVQRHEASRCLLVSFDVHHTAVGGGCSITDDGTVLVSAAGCSLYVTRDFDAARALEDELADEGGGGWAPIRT